MSGNKVLRKLYIVEKAPVNYNLKPFTASEEFYDLTDNQCKQLVRQILQEGCRIPDRELDQKETVDVVLDIKNNDETGRKPIWEDEVKLPDWKINKLDQTEQFDPFPTPYVR